jgi:hypothetical protein
MDRLEPYKRFQIRAYQEWSGLWLAEARNPSINRPDADYIATPSGHPTPEAAINFIKQMIDKQMVDEDALARLTRRGGEEIIETLYGINPKTFEVETVSLNRSGELRNLGKDVEPRTHYVAHARDRRVERGVAAEPAIHVDHSALGDAEALGDELDLVRAHVPFIERRNLALGLA